ncbi:MAG TPA: TIGR03067 domain-containing protein [Gemmataceae bacterium]|jgi:uncharacterized protein (TIGR03067 family)|nr:TIGR03067 domain-containing protein [Gemmataceae bacterium]
MTASLLVGLALVVGAPAKKDPAPKDPPSLMGEWLAESGIMGGKPENPPPGTTITFLADGKLKMNEGGGNGQENGSYKFDAKKDPAEIDISPEAAGKGPTLAGIYKIEGDTLTICFAMGGDRPKKFESPAGSMLMLVTCKRAKKD